MNSLERLKEKFKLLQIIDEYGFYNLSDKEILFVEDMKDADFVTPKQLYWLRDIKDKTLEEPGESSY